MFVYFFILPIFADIDSILLNPARENVVNP